MTPKLIVKPGTQVFINQGIGWASLPVKSSGYPEIAVLELADHRLMT